MSTTPHNVLQLARQGKPDAIAALMNQHLQARGITAQVTQQDDALHVLLESAQALSQKDLVTYVQKGITGLSLADVHRVSISGRQAGHVDTDWTETISFNNESAPAGSPASNGGTGGEPTDAGVEEIAFDQALFNGSDTANTDLDLDLSEAGLATTDDLDLGLEADLGEIDSSELLDLELDTGDLDAADTDLADFDLGLSDSADNAADGLDLNLNTDDLQEATDELQAALADLDMPAADHSQASWAEAELSDDNLDLGFDGDFAMAAPEAADTGLEDLDLSLDDASASATTDLEDLDLNLDASEAADNALDLDSGDLDLDFDHAEPVANEQNLELPETDFLNEAANEAASPDWELGLEVPPESSDLDLDLEASVDNLAGLDLAADEGGSADAGLDLDFDDSLDFDNLEAPQEDADPGLDLSESLDLDAPTPPADEGNLDFNAVFDAEAVDSSQDELDLGADLNLDSDDAPEAEGGPDFDADLNFDALLDASPDDAPQSSADLDLDFGDDLDQVAEADSNLDIDDLDFDTTSLEGTEVDTLELSELDLNLETENQADGAASPLSLGEGLDGDLWETDDRGAESPAGASPEAATSDIDWDLDPGETAEPFAAEDSAAVLQTEDDDIDWDPLDLDGAPPELESEAEIPAFEERDTAPEFDLADLDDANESSAPKDVEPVDLMLSEELDLSGEGDSEEFDLNLDDGVVAAPFVGLQAADAETNITEAAGGDHGTAADAAAAAFSAPQSPVNKLLSEDAFTPSVNPDQAPDIPEPELNCESPVDAAAEPELAFDLSDGAEFDAALAEEGLDEGFGEAAAEVEALTDSAPFAPVADIPELESEAPVAGDFPFASPDDGVEAAAESDFPFAPVEEFSEVEPDAAVASDFPFASPDDGAEAEAEQEFSFEDEAAVLEDDAPLLEEDFAGATADFTPAENFVDEVSSDFPEPDFPFEGEAESADAVPESLDEASLDVEPGIAAATPADDDGNWDADDVFSDPEAADWASNVTVAPDDFSDIDEASYAAHQPASEPGLKPEDFPIFNTDEETAFDAPNRAEPDFDSALEPADITIEQPGLGQSAGENVDIDTLELDTMSPVNKSGSDDFSPAIDDFPLDQVESFDDEDIQPLEELGHGETAASGQAQAEDDFDDELVDSTLVNELGADANANWDDVDQTDDADAFIDDLTGDNPEPTSTSVHLTDEDLDNLDSNSGGSSNNWLVGLGLGVVGLGLVGILFNAILGNPRRQPAEPVAEPPVEMPVPAEGEGETPAEPEATEPAGTEPEATEPAPEQAPPAEPPAAEADYFREAVNAAQNAANLAQTASTGAEWQAVADSWAKAINLMKQVPESDPNYEVAQQKAVDYQPNLDYARRNAAQN